MSYNFIHYRCFFYHNNLSVATIQALSFAAHTFPCKNASLLIYLILSGLFAETPVELWLAVTVAVVVISVALHTLLCKNALSLIHLMAVDLFVEILVKLCLAVIVTVAPSC